MRKRTVYISLFVLLGILGQFLVHGVVEIWYINLLLKDFERYSLGLAWPTWFMIHHFGALLLLVLGVIAGFFQGRFWWRLIYEEKRLGQWFPFLRRFGL